MVEIRLEHSLSISYQLSMLTIADIYLMLSRFPNPFMYTISLDTQNTSLETGVLVSNLEMRKQKFRRIK